MSTLEKTISMMENLSEYDLLQVQDLIKKLFRQHESETPDNAISRILKPMSRDDFLEDLKDAEEEIANGQFKTAEEALRGLEQRYGF